MALQEPPPFGVLYVPAIELPDTEPLYVAPAPTAPNVIWPP